MSLHPALEKVKQAIEIRRMFRTEHSHTNADYYHDTLLPARWGKFKVLYCPTCLRGHITDLVQDEDLLETKALGVRLVRPWWLKCIEKMKQAGTTNA